MNRERIYRDKRERWFAMRTAFVGERQFELWTKRELEIAQVKYNRLKINFWRR